MVQRVRCQNLLNLLNLLILLNLLNLLFYECLLGTQPACGFSEHPR